MRNESHQKGDIERMSMNPQKKGLSRRRFLGGSLAAIAGTGLAGSARLFGSLTPAEKVPLKITLFIDLNINLY